MYAAVNYEFQVYKYKYHVDYLALIIQIYDMQIYSKNLRIIKNANLIQSVRNPSYFPVPLGKISIQVVSPTCLKTNFCKVEILYVLFCIINFYDRIDSSQQNFNSTKPHRCKISSSQTSKSKFSCAKIFDREFKAANFVRQNIRL